jgi:lipopolysaccharide/colanic/teichoic acid biosynthesis glycosyltransferase
MRRDYDNQKDRDFFQAYVGGNIDGNQVNQDKLFKPVKMEHITRTGRILRKTSLDELPQIINILKGEMSLVGPRPNLPWEVEKYKDWHCERLNALPGITGLAQVRGRSSLPFEQIVQYDIEYIRKQSLKLDLQILWQTVVMVLTSRGAG